MKILLVLTIFPHVALCVSPATFKCKLNTGSGISESRRYSFWPFCLAPLLFIRPDIASRHRGGIKYLQYSKLNSLKDLPVRHLSIYLPLTGIFGRTCLSLPKHFFFFLCRGLWVKMNKINMRFSVQHNIWQRWCKWVLFGKLNLGSIKW